MKHVPSPSLILGSRSTFSQQHQTGCRPLPTCVSKGDTNESPGTCLGVCDFQHYLIYRFVII